MNTLHLGIIVILITSLLSNSAFADSSSSTAYGGLVGLRVANFKSDHATYPIWYKITNSTVTGTPLDLPAKALIFMINASSNGVLTVELPRSIIDSKNGTKDIPYYVTIDDVATLIGKPFPVQVDEISNDNPRIIKINFTQTTKQIEIVGTYFVENYSPKTEYPSKLFSPLKQFQSGVAAKDVKCNKGLELLMKSHDNMPACVKSTSVQRLLGQGWINPYNFNGEYIGKESIILSAYQGVSNEAFYNNGTVASNFTITVNINNFKPSNASLVLQVCYGDGILYKTVSIPSDTIQSDGFYKYHLIAMSDKNHPVPFKVVATYNKETATTYAPVFAHP